MWYFIAFGTTVHCFPAPPLMSQHIQPYTTWQASNFGILCNTKFPRRRVGWLRRKKRSHIVGPKTSSASTEAGCTAALMTTRTEAWEMCGGFCSPWRSCRTVGSHKILLVLQQLQPAASWMWDFFGELHRPRGARCEHITALRWQQGSAPIICLCSSQLKRARKSYRQQLISGSAVTFPCSYGCQLLRAYLQLERTCIFRFSLSLGEYKMQSASTEQKRMCLLVWWKSGQLCYGPRHWHSSVGTEPGLLGLIFIKRFLMIYILSLGINLNGRERFGPLH